MAADVCFDWTRGKRKGEKERDQEGAEGTIRKEEGTKGEDAKERVSIRRVRR